MAMDSSDTLHSQFCMCGNIMFPVNGVGRKAAGGNAKPTILEQIGQMLNTEADVDFAAIKKKFKLDHVDLLSILRTNWYQNEIERNEQKLVYNHVYAMLSPEELAKTDELKQLQNPKIIKHQQWRECAVGHNRQPLEEGSLFRESSMSSKFECNKQRYSYGIFMDQTLERTNNFTCPLKEKCGANNKEAFEYWKNIPYSGKAIKFIRNDHQAEYLCTPCEILAYLRHKQHQPTAEICKKAECNAPQLRCKNGTCTATR